MDPTETLAKIRSLQQELDSADIAVVWDLTPELSEAVKNLDEWISKGGFLPTQWKRHAIRSDLERGLRG